MDMEFLADFDEVVVESDPGFVLPDDHKFTRTPEELMELLGKASWEYGYASRKLNDLQASLSIRIPQVRIKLLSRSLHLIENEKLRGHLLRMFDDAKFKWTNEILNSCIFIEQRELLTRRDMWESIKARAEREHDQWSRQLNYYQSKMKSDLEEMRMGGYSGA